MSEQPITTTRTAMRIAITRPELTRAGTAANQAAAAMAFDQYRANHPAQTLRAQQTDLASFARFFVEIGINDAPTAKALQNDPQEWQGITFGLVLAFREWLMQQGYAIATVNRRLATIKSYARLAGLAMGELAMGEEDSTGQTFQNALGNALEQIKAVRGFGHKQGRNRDAKRIEEGKPTRIGAKKPYKAVTLTHAQAKQLKSQPPTPQGRRDTLLMCLLLDHGLRCGEVAMLTIHDFDLVAGTLRFYRPKVDKQQTHKLTSDTYLALRAWVDSGDAPTHGSILRRSNKWGSLGATGMTERGITGRVRELGRAMGIEKLSAHDCRHYWATRATQQGTHPRALQQAGGWNSSAMVMRYVDESEIANEGVVL